MKIKILLFLLFSFALAVIARDEAISANKIFIPGKQINECRLTICDFRSLHGKDSILKSIKLKKGYTLMYKATDTGNIVLVGKGKESNVVGEEIADSKMPLDVLGYLYADFDNTFAMAVHIDANPIKVVIYDKKTGGMQIYGKSPFYLDTLKGIMMYEGAYGKAGKLVLYDSKTGKVELFVAPKDTPCFGYCCWKAVEVTDKEVKIEYINMKQEKTIKGYPRK